MYDGDKEYKLMVKESPDCFVPKPSRFHQIISNTPEFVRRYFMAKGRQRK